MAPSPAMATRPPFASRAGTTIAPSASVACSATARSPSHHASTAAPAIGRRAASTTTMRNVAAGAIASLRSGATLGAVADDVVARAAPPSGEGVFAARSGTGAASHNQASRSTIANAAASGGQRERIRIAQLPRNACSRSASFANPSASPRAWPSRQPRWRSRFIAASWLAVAVRQGMRLLASRTTRQVDCGPPRCMRRIRG